ncbi:MAG: hypothetical protein COX02_00930, partial [Candidatus Vogelbacteria bacterium CG22_combo_CG10-13_8_21_14_all_37_9]
MQKVRKTLSEVHKNPYGTKVRNAKTGYSLQIERLSYTGKEGMRSFKIPLENKNKEVFDEFVKKIRNDYISQVGLLNLSDWYEHYQEKQEHYSLADFWLDSLRAGVIFAHKETEIKNLISKIRGDKSIVDKFNASIKKKHADLYALVDIKALYDFLTSDARRGLKTEEEFFNSKRNTLFPKFRKKDNKAVDLWVKKFIGLDNKDKLNFTKKFIGFDPNPQIKYDHTFFFHQDINFDLERITTPKELISTYKKFLGKNKDLYGSDETTEDQLKMVLGFHNNHGAFSKYFNASLEAFRGRDNSLVEQIINNSPYWNSHRKELEKRIIFLQVQSKKIKETELGKPHEYLASFGGKFESWVSNYLRQEEEVKRQLFGYEENKKGQKKFIVGNKQELDKIIRGTDEYEIKAISKETIGLTQKCLKLLEQLKDSVDDYTLSLYRQLIVELRIRLNVEFQETYPELIGKSEKDKEKDAKNKRADKRYPQIFKDIKLIPNFLGETKQMVYKKFIRSADILYEGINFIDQIDKQITQNLLPCFKNDKERIEFTEKQFETLRRKYYLMNSSRFHHVIEGIINNRKLIEMKKRENSELKTFSDSKFVLSKLFLKKGKKYENEVYYTFYINPKARDQRRIKIVLDINGNNSVGILQDLVQKLKPKWDDIIKKNDMGELIDAIEIEKVRLGILIALYCEHKFKIKKELLSLDLFASAYQYLELEDDPEELSGTNLGRFLQSLVCSEIKGAINKISRTEYIERYTVQPMNTEKNYPLLINKEGKATWHIAAKDDLSKKKGGGTVAMNQKIGKNFFGKQDYKTVFMLQDKRFDLLTSKYHLQFLSKTLDTGGGSWWKNKNIDLNLSSYSFIFEQKVKVEWDLTNLDHPIKIKPSENSDDRRLFVSIPFVIKPKQTKRKDLQTRVNYMGIDIGEYGLAWTIINIDLKNKKINKISKQGFIYEPLTHKVRDYVATIKDNQVRGTFGMPDTKLARLRENAITSLRNQVHDIAMRYDAKPVYEFEISNFETGSNKVKVIYDSVKRADIGRGQNNTEADNTEVNLVWGKTSKQFGSQIGAYATSYICSFCGYSPYYEFENSKSGDEEGARDNLYQMKKLSRPSLEDFLQGNPVYKTFRDFDKYKNDQRLQKTGDKDGEWKTHRGNTAIYACQKC